MALLAGSAKTVGKKLPRWPRYEGLGLWRLGVAILMDVYATGKVAGGAGRAAMGAAWNSVSQD